MTLNTTTVNVARVIGPTIAAVLVGTVGIGWCFVVNAASFGFVIVSLLSLDTRRLYPVPPVPRGRGQLRAGLRHAAGVPAIIRPLLMMALVGTFTFEFEVSLPLLAETTFHGTASTYSWLWTELPCTRRRPSWQFATGCLWGCRWPPECTRQSAS